MTKQMLVPGIRWHRTWDTTVQFGSDPETAVVMRFPDNAAIGLLDLLDGSHDEQSYLAAARSRGIDREHARTLLDLLRRSGLLVAASALTAPPTRGADQRAVGREAAALALRRGRPPMLLLDQRGRHKVFVNGVGELAHDIAAQLRSAGVGRVWCADDGLRGKPTFAVLVNAAQPVPLIALAHHRRRLPYLRVAVHEGAAHIGPLVRPGRTACVRCVELHYREALPQWQPAPTGTAGELVLAETVIRQLTATVAAAQVLLHLDGERPDAEASTIQIRPPMQVRQRHWRPHPDCGCAAEPVAAAVAPTR